MPDTPLGWSPSFCSICWTEGSESLTIRGLIRFNLNNIPSDSYVIKATLSLYCDPASTHYQLQYGDNQSYLSRVTQHWDQDTVTWNTQPNSTMNGAIILPTSTSSTQHYPDIDVTPHVRDMVFHPETNFGWKLQLITEALYRSMEFASSNDINDQYRPKLTIIYKQCPVPVAGFTYTVQYPEVHFTDTSHSSQAWYWDFGDGYQSTLKNPIHTYSQLGKYLTCLTITDSCGSDTHCDSITVVPSTIENIKETNLLVYPNPATDKITIENYKNLHRAEVLGIYNMSGAFINDYYFQNDNKMEIDVSKLMPGVYIIKTLTSKGIEVQKLVIH